jgi:hypothetical protein
MEDSDNQYHQTRSVTGKFTVVRTRHDRFVKEWLKEFLTDFGEVKTEREVSGEVRSIDLIFSPHPDRANDLQSLGLFRRILAQHLSILQVN